MVPARPDGGLARAISGLADHSFAIFLSCFNCRFSFRLCWGFFFVSDCPLSFPFGIKYLLKTSIGGGYVVVPVAAYAFKCNPGGPGRPAFSETFRPVPAAFSPASRYLGRPLPFTPERDRIRVDSGAFKVELTTGKLPLSAARLGRYVAENLTKGRNQP